MFKIRHSVIRVFFIAIVASAIAALQALGAEPETEDPNDALQRELIEVLRSDAPPQDKAITCKKLAVYGGKDAVPALAVLLSDKDLASWARIALEAIPDQESDDALRHAMSGLKGKLLVGVINSIGLRRDAKAVEGLTKLLKDTDAEVASSAAVALGRIGDAAATAALEQSLAAAPAAVRSAVAEGCILCAERRLAENKPAEAAKLYDLVRNADVPQQRILEATRGTILAQQSAGAPLLVEQLQSPDKSRFQIGLRTARELSGKEATDALMAAMGRAAPDRQALLILALADKGDAAVLPAMIQAAKSGSVGARIAAIRVLQRLGNATCVPVLLDAALEADPDLSQAALEVLADLPGTDVDADLAGRLLKAEGKSRQVLIRLAGQRNVAAAVPALLKAAEDSDTQIRAEALMALGYTVTLGDLQVLIAQVANAPQNAEEAQAAELALRTACQRMPNRDACAEKLVAAMSRAPTPVKGKILETLTVMGGAGALQAVGSAAKNADPEMQDIGSRLLGEWMNPEAAPVLLDLAKTARDGKYKIRALRGYIRIARQFDVPPKERADMCRIALATSTRNDEKKLVMEVLERYPTVDMLQVATEAGKDPSLKNDATRISLLIAQKMGGSVDPRKLLAQFGQKPVKVEILKAEYGAGEKFKDVTAILKKQVRDYPLIVLPSSKYNDAFGGDPVPGVVKQLKIQYRIDGKAGEVSLPENATIMLPIP